MTNNSYNTISTTEQTNRRVMSREEKRMARRYERAFNRMITMGILAMIIVVAVTALITSAVMSRPILVQTDEISVVAEPYDSLWSLVSENDACPENMDIRKYIQIVRDYNDKESADIDVGETIYLPIFTENKY